MDKLLEIKSLTVKYNDEGYVNRDINFTLDYREILGIVGESGSGKTTLIKTIINLLSSSAEVVSGEIVFDGNVISNYNKEQWRKLRGNEMAMVFQNPGSYFNPIMKIGRQFTQSIKNHKNISRNEAIKKAKTSLKKMKLNDLDRIMNAYPSQLSGGMQQRVAIAMAYAMEPKLILADEPTSALDVITQAEIINELMELRKNFDTSIIMVTHDIACAAYMSDRIAVMSNGQIVEMDTKERLITRPQMKYTKTLLDNIPKLKGI